MQKEKKLHTYVFFLNKHSKFCSVSLGQKVERKLFFSEEWKTCSKLDVFDLSIMMLCEGNGDEKWENEDNKTRFVYIGLSTHLSSRNIDQSPAFIMFWWYH